MHVSFVKDDNNSGYYWQSISPKCNIKCNDGVICSFSNLEIMIMVHTIIAFAEQILNHAGWSVSIRKLTVVCLL